jgi:acetoin utilization deacetylase AcuC-like enzyme
MQTFYHPDAALHAPEWYVADGAVRPCPDSPVRPERILAALQAAAVHVAYPTTDPWPAIRGIHAADYLEYLQTIHAAWTAHFQAERPVIPDTFIRRAGARRPRDPIAQPGFYCFDMAAPVVAGTWRAALAGATSAASAADALLKGQRAAYALCRPPGHHAGSDYCGGFCYLNNAAIAAQHLLNAGMRRVAIFDIDYHHGNGTQDIFYARRDVLFASIHAEPDTQYPYFWGHADETGEGGGAGFNLNLPLPRGTDEAAWLAAFDHAAARIRDFRPEALIVSLGVDTFEKDTVGDFGITLLGFAEIGRRLRAFDLPTALVQEGGYNLDAVGPCVEATLSAFPAPARAGS